MDRIKEEATLNKEYGYKNKKELWKVNSILRNFRGQARRLIPLNDKQATLEKQQLMNRLVSLGIIKEDARVEEVVAQVEPVPLAEPAPVLRGNRRAVDCPGVPRGDRPE